MPFLSLNRKNLLILVFIILIIGVPIAALKYTDLVRLWNKAFPQGPGSGTVRLEVPPIASKSASLQTGPFTCPSTSQFCKTGKDVTQNNQYVGFGKNLPPANPILAAFDGQISSITSTLPSQYNDEKITTVYLDNTERGLRAVYYFKGQPPASGFVKAGDKISTTGSSMAYYGNNSLVFAIIKNDFVNGAKIHLSSGDFSI